MAPTTFEKLEADREYVRDELKFLEDQMTKHTTTALTYSEVEMYLAQVEDTQKLLSTNHIQIRHHAPKGTDMDPFVADYHILRGTASRVYSGLHGIKMSLPPPSTSSSASSTTSTPSHQTIKLPPLELPKFGGNLQEWVSFRDLFISAVDKSSLTKVEKLTQLKALLTGEAARQIRSIVLSDTNYDIAWKALQDRYENNRELLFSIMKRLMTQPVVTSSSATHLRSLIDTTKECVRSLEVLTIPTQHWDAVLLFILFSKMDLSSRELWEQSLPDTSIPSLSRMYEFLEQRARALAACSAQPPPKSQPRPPQNQVRSHHVSTNNACKLGCTDSHPIFRCPQFKEQTIPQRSESIKRLKLCINCFGFGHLASTCSSQHKCKICDRKHHTMLHFEKGGAQLAQTTHSSNEQISQQQPPVSNHHIQPVGKVKEIKTGIIATAIVQVVTAGGESNRRAMIDMGSTNTSITERAARMMNLPLYKCKIPMEGLQSSSLGEASYVTSFSFKPMINSLSSYTATALVVKSIGGNMPCERLKSDEWNHLQGLELADPFFHNPGPVDILFGTDVSWNLLEDMKIKRGKPGEPLAIKSTLGWLVAGPNIHASPIRIFNAHIDLDYLLRRFWEQENVTEEIQMTEEEAQCEKHFTLTHTRDHTGRFTVSLPFKNPRPQLGESRQAALRRFLSLENKYVHHRNVKDAQQIRKLSDQWSQYKKFMMEYEQLGHMQPVPQGETNAHCNSSYYIPHHCVFKESSTTTKLRVVFDASASTSNGTSLNQCMMVGPQLQDNLNDIHLRFRIHPIAFTADIEKMYRQIRMAKEDTTFQRIFWRSDPKQPIKEYYLLTVTYGEASAPYLAVKCLQQLAKDERERYPDAAAVVLRDFFVDDTTSGCSTLEEAKKTVHQLIQLCKSGGMELRKWTSNSRELLSDIPEQLRENSSLVELQQDTTVKTLGVYWNPTQDKYIFKLNLPADTPGNLTKRIILSQIAKIFDPLGWLAPIIIVCKIFMQDLWKLQVDWDDILPTNTQTKWKEIRKSLMDIEKVQIPRCVTPRPNKLCYLVGCSDASLCAISAAVYICCLPEDNSSWTCHLLTSKTRVAPVRHVTLPRLELNGAVLLSDLLKSVYKCLNMKFTEVRAFTDSTITLHWINSQPTRWKPYVRRRVQTIQENMPQAQWFHIPGERNPADCASRGIPAVDIIHHPLWWNGAPDFTNATSNATDLLEEEIQQLQAEVQPVSFHVAQPRALHPVFSRYSSFLKLERVIAFVFRFIRNWCSKQKNQQLELGPLTAKELILSHTVIIRHLQHTSFPMEMQALTKGVALPTSNNLIRLSPFLSKDGLLRVGGRLRHANIQFGRKHPILLPKNHHITTSIINDIHLSNLHAGPSVTLAKLQQQYWVVNGRDTVRFIIRKCVRCVRHRADTMKQIMGDLPYDRVNPARPFSKAGVDYAGPFLIRPMVRSKVTLKCWIAIFVCFVTRAIHIELVSSLSTDCFLAALRRFINRRGVPVSLYSDCGTNFKGADKVLREFFIIAQNAAVQKEVASQKILWHFNPAGAPHFGGLWEAGVKSIKHHLTRVMGSARLTYEEFQTLLTQIEGILNSRPLVPASSDPSDLDVLTPGHFLVGTAITAIPEPNLMETKENHLKRWDLLQQQQQLFWKRWSNEFITRLQQRPKWCKTFGELQTGNLVIIKDERLPPLKWKMGRVLAVHPGADGHVRVATLRTSEGEIKRPIVKLSLLPISNYE